MNELELIEALIKKGEGQAYTDQSNHFFLHAIALGVKEIVRILGESGDKNE